ncbi:MAG: flagellar hook capping protein [Candidatus Hydrogenedentota bacterium]|nr:MAG: flagellar hook capping protein [Candidatus Hydrogenedentota bacterium]
MNALVGIRGNATGLFSPTTAQRAEVAQKLAETAAARTSNTASARTATIAAATASSENGSTQPARDVNDELGKDAFLRLLVLQLQNQDPLDPVDNSDMLAQLAQFSALEGQNNLNESFVKLSGNIDQLNFISASQLLGKTVKGVDLNGDLRTGLVEGVHLDGSIVLLTVDGELMSMTGILSIDSQPAEDTDEST